MSTLDEARTVYLAVRQCIGLFGATAEFMEGARKHINDLGDAIVEELNILSVNNAVLAPGSAELGPKSEVALEELKSWLRSTSSDFASL